MRVIRSTKTQTDTTPEPVAPNSTANDAQNEARNAAQNTTSRAVPHILRLTRTAADALTRTAADAPISASEAIRLIHSGHAWDGMRVEGALNFAGDDHLMYLPENLRCTSLNVSGCMNLEGIPSGLVCNELIARNLPIKRIEGPITVRVRMDLTGCRELEALPNHLSLNTLDITDCINLKTLPASTRVTGFTEIAGSGLVSAPRGLKLRWRGVQTDARILSPESITGQQVLSTRNLELRRVLLERMGYERFISDVGGLVIDRDRDAGGERRLIRVPFPGDEDVVVVSLICPSTAHQYVLRVPPWMRSCRQAVAWIAGFERESDYRPVAEA
jgi:hypothetical protein